MLKYKNRWDMYIVDVPLKIIKSRTSFKNASISVTFYAHMFGIFYFMIFFRVSMTSDDYRLFCFAIFRFKLYSIYLDILIVIYKAVFQVEV